MMRRPLRGFAAPAPLLEMGVLYPAGVPSPSESIDSIPPIVVHGTIAKCDGDLRAAARSATPPPVA